jgi:hypothetical protein
MYRRAAISGPANPASLIVLMAVVVVLAIVGVLAGG